jgi:hypothetical protein
MTTAWSTHQPGLNFMKYLSILPPEEMAERVDCRDSRTMHQPPAGRQKSDFTPEFIQFHIALLSSIYPLKKSLSHVLRKSRRTVPVSESVDNERRRLQFSAKKNRILQTNVRRDDAGDTP